MMIKISRFIGVVDSPINYVSTWCGYEWKGDSLSSREYFADEKWSSTRSYNGWNDGLTNREKLFIKFFFGHFMQKHFYITEDKNNLSFIQIILVLSTLIFPLKTERDFYKIEYYKKKVRQYKKNKPKVLIILYLICEPLYYFVIRWKIFSLFMKITRVRLSYRK